MKTGNLIINWLLLLYATCRTERLYSPSDKIWRQGNFKNPNFQTILWIGKNLEVEPRPFKNPNFPSLLWIGNNLVVCKAQDQRLKIQILNLWMNWENLYPNLSFTSLKTKWEIHIKKGWSPFNRNDWDIF